jgi:CRISPR/Cas system-associated exonuclease Cas4 (RecB family)
MSEMESRLMPGGKRQFEDAESAVADHEAPPPLNEGERLSMALRVNAVEARLAELAHAQSEIQAPPPTTPQSLPAPSRHENEPQQIPARMLNEFVYCQRLFYFEFVEGVFVESVDTLRGEAIHKRVDSGNGALPKAKRKTEADKAKAEAGKTANAESTSTEAETKTAEPETIHSRSVQMGSERLGVVAKMDLVETKTEKDDLFAALEVCPVDYKAGAPKEGEEANELWDTDKMQLGLQARLLAKTLTGEIAEYIPLLTR